MGIDGTWYNELGSKMDLSISGNQLTGTYETHVGAALGKYPIVGKVDEQGGPSQGVGFVVVWENDLKDSNAVTTWSGQYRRVDGKEVIRTMWLLTAESTVADEWASTLVGQDIFTRNMPSAEQTATRRKMAVTSFPRNLVTP